MITTEAEAKTKWCPMARVAITFNYNMAQCAATANRYDSKALGYCIGSDCAVWNWLVDEDFEPERLGCCGLIYKPGY